jgi:hypothetical protein
MRFGLGETHASDLGIGEHGVTERRAIQREPGILECVEIGDLRLFLADAGERLAAVHIADGPESWCAGLEPVGDESLLVSLDSGALQAKLAGIGASARCH